MGKVRSNRYIDTSRPVLTVTEAATESGLHESRIRQLIYDGRLRALRTATMWVIERGEWARFMATPRPRGRPRTRPTPTTDPATPRRGRGRPRKSPPSPPSASSSPPLPRGRPRKCEGVE